ncbi:hypothetical protein BKK79_00060 [Cupriavidus sp. USMAA2-4]|uniref:phage head spike fiber domain-containing protein n=1 Tax=Cupriavidus sp. USMAA2-4 TaxID=876364 RepID=UPI0008A672E7|nr:hypothetical protein [Cupriavidus sp. USMAA2-4]AOY90395.1 hypothetical protein BKK79_00060 [Cupriavidus sp. USMAA2-4]
MLFNRNFGDLVTFARASSAWTYSNGGVLVPVAAGVPRFEYDPSTLVALGMPIEESMANLCTYSEFPNGTSDAPTRGGPITAASLSLLGYFSSGIAVGWDGTNHAYAYKAVTLSASTQYTVSVFVKMDDGAAPSFGAATGADVSNDFAMVLGSSTIGPNSFTVKALRDGVYRVSGTLTTPASPGPNLGVVKYSTNTPRTFKVTGYQIRAGAYAGSYVPTQGAQATRAAENATISDLSKIGFNVSEGTVFAEFMVPRLTAGVTGDVGQGVVTLGDSALNNYLAVGVARQAQPFCTAKGRPIPGSSQRPTRLRSERRRRWHLPMAQGRTTPSA